jgi:hypothetical protein
MKGGVILFRGTGAAACRYLESDRSRADDYYLGDGATLAAFTVTDGAGEVRATAELDAAAYAGWVDWVNPLTGTSMGKPRLPGEEGTSKHGSPRFAEMVVNTPKSLSVAAALHPDVSVALDAAQADAVAEIRRFLALHSVTRVGPCGRQEVVPVERLQTVAVVHKTSRAGDPHRHVHFQIGTRVWAAGKWRGLDTAALFKQQGAIRALGTAVLAAYPALADALDRVGLTLDPVTGEVTELQPFNGIMSKRGVPVEKNLAELEAAWEEMHPGQELGPVVHARMITAAWAKDRPQKRPAALAHEDAWRDEIARAGYDPTKFLQRQFPSHAPLGVDDLEIQAIASRALDRCAAAASTWTRHTLREQVARIVTNYGVRATPTDLRELVALTTNLAAGDCLSVLPPGSVQPEHVAHLTSLQVIAAETRLRDLLTASTKVNGQSHPVDLTALAAAGGLDDAQAHAAAAIASTDPLVIVEGAAGAGKTTMLGVAISGAASEGRPTRILTPTKKAADVAARELGVPAESVAKLLYAHGWRWSDDGVWSRVEVEPPGWARLVRRERIVVDEAGVLDQDSAIALLALAAESGATVALVGDRAQLPAVGRGGVLDIAAAITTGVGGIVHDLDTVHRFTDPSYADLTLRLRAGSNPAHLFNDLHAFGLIQLHMAEDDAHEWIANEASAVRAPAVTVATNDEARGLNERIHNQRVAAGEVEATATATGRDGLPIGVGDVIATRKNDSTLGVANRQTWTVQHVDPEGALLVIDAGNNRKQQRSVTLPASYVAEHVHLAYAATGYGVQGVTTATAHTLLSEALDAAGVYVGMTRGSNANTLHVVAENLDEARDQFIDAMRRDHADRGLQVATDEAKTSVTGLTADGPVKIVNDERARLAQLIAQAEEAAARWERAAAILGGQAQTHAREEADARNALRKAEMQLEAARTEAVAPLLAQAALDGRAYIAADWREREAWQASRTAGRLSKRGAERKLAATGIESRALRDSVLDKWGSIPDTGRWGHRTRDSLETWAERVASDHADAVPSVLAARRRAHDANVALTQIRQRQRNEAAELADAVYGRRHSSSHRGMSGLNSAEGRSVRWQQRADGLRTYLARIESLPIDRALSLIEAQQAKAECAGPPRPAPHRTQSFELPAKSHVQQANDIAQGM